MIETQYERGVYLPRQDLWLDPWDPKPLAFVSHAHSDHIAPHREIILSEVSGRLMQARLPGKRREHRLPFGERTQILRELDLTLLPAGHILGSAQCFLEAEHGTLLYTGDFKLRPGRSAEPIQWCQAETLIMETTYGLPRYQLPPTEAVIDQIVAFCRDTLESGAVPILLGYSLGKAQEILCALTGADLRPMLHGSVFNMTRIYEQFGKLFGPYERYHPDKLAGKVLICPPSAHRSLMLEKIADKRVAVISGWGIEPNAIYRYQVDAAFPLSDHADYTDLIRYVELVQPQRVLTLHGFAAEFAADLRRRGVEAWALNAPNQLELTINIPLSTAGQAQIDPFSTEIPSEFLAFAKVGQAIAASPAKLVKAGLLANYLRGLNRNELGIVSVYFTGRPFPQNDPRSLQIGWSVIKRALIGATRLTENEFRRISSAYGDAGKLAQEALSGRTTPEPFTLAESGEFFDALQKANGPMTKAELLRSRLSRLSALEGEYLIKILTGDLRIGLREGLVEEAIADAFKVSLDQVKEGNMLLGDIGQTARLASEDRLSLADLALFRPIKCMLASPGPTAEAIWGRFGNDFNAGSTPDPSPIIYVEDKYDGIRAQLHRDSKRVEIFSRDLRPMTGQFLELVDQAHEFEDELILDGEIIAFEEGRRLTFFDLQKRLGRKNESRDLFDRASANVPVAFVVFDLLWKNGRSLLRKPLRERRETLGQLKLPSQFRIAEIYPAHSIAEIEEAFQHARRRLNEGLMIKDPESFYLPGRRGMSWFKLKRELATLDVVVVGAELGHGKRSHVLSDYTFAVRDEKTGQLAVIGKAYSGLTDGEIAELSDRLMKETVTIQGRYREVQPLVVLEIAFDSIQPSSRHSSGLALRFPRIKAIRRDKGVETIDTLAYAQSLAARRSSLTANEHK